MESEETRTPKLPVAPGLQISPEFVPLKPKGRFGEGGPPGNKKALKHGLYSETFTEKEQADRQSWEQSIIDDLGGAAVISTAQNTLIRTAGMLEMKRARIDRAITENRDEPAQEHVLALVNSMRLILCALGLERRSKPVQTLQDYIRGKGEQPGEEVSV